MLKRPPGEHTGQVAPVLTIGVNVLAGGGAISCVPGRLSCRRAASQGLLGRFGPQRFRPHVGQRDPAVDRGNADDGPVIGPPDELLIAPRDAWPRGTRTDISNSSGCIAVSKKPWKKSSALTVRLPPGLCSSTEPPSATSAIGRSAAGSACDSEPPMVPRWRICGSPTWAGSVGEQRCFGPDHLAGSQVRVPGGRADRRDRRRPG